MLATLLRVLTNIVIARSLGPEGKGIITIVLLVLGQSALLLTLGVEIALIYYAGRRWKGLDELASASMSLGIILGFAASGLALMFFALFLRKVIPSRLLPLLVLMSSMLLMALTARFLQSLIRVSGRIIEGGTLGVLVALLNLVAVSTLLITGLGLQGVLFGLWLSDVLASIFTLALALKWRIVQRGPVFAPSIWKSLVTYGLKLHIGSVLQALNYRFDTYIVAFFLGTASVGLYSVAVAMAELLWLLPGSLGTVLMQRVATWTEQEANAMMGPLNRLTSGTLLVGATVYALLGNWLIRLIYGKVFAHSYYPLLLLLPGIWALGLWKNIMNDLSVRGYPASKSYTTGVAVVLTISLDIVLIPRWGIVGAAIASSIAYITAFVIALWLYCRVTSYKPADILIPRITDFSLAFEKVRNGFVALRTGTITS